jgi:hypothetical protein
MDKLIIEHFTKNKQTKTIMEGIIDLYDNELPFIVAEYFCYAFFKNIICNEKVSYKLFQRFTNYKDSTFFIFEKNIINDNVKLKGIKILIPNEKEFEFVDEHSNYIYSKTFSEPIVWNDNDKHHDAYNQNTYHNIDDKYCGVCTIEFD